MTPFVTLSCIKVYSTGGVFIKLNERNPLVEECDLKAQHMAFDLLNSTILWAFLTFSVLILKEISHNKYINTIKYV